METFDVAIVGGGPAGATCAAFCAQEGLRTIVIEREKFPREKVCGDCLNPECWPVLRRLEVDQRVRSLPHGVLEAVEFIGLNNQKVRVDWPENAEIAIKRSAFDSLLLGRAAELGAEIREETTLTLLEKAADDWELTLSDALQIRSRVMVAADGRNSTVARLLGVFPRSKKERVALQAHIPLPPDFGNQIVLQLLPGGYSGQAPTDEHELNLCLVGQPKSIRALQDWARQRFGLSSSQHWRTITPLTRAAIPAAQKNLFFVGDAARVVEPFTGEGIFYALRSGEIAARVTTEIIRRTSKNAANEYASQHAAIYGGRLWINGLARAAVLSPKLGSILLEVARMQPALLRFLTRKVVR